MKNKKLKIIKLQASNIKTLKAIEIEANGKEVILKGSNGAGKSSILIAIMLALSYKKGSKIVEKPLRKGEKTAIIKVDLDEYNYRGFNKEKLIELFRKYEFASLLREIEDNPKNSMIFVNYQGEGSLGRRVQRGEREYAISKGSTNEVVSIKLEVHTVEGFSGHSSRHQLMNFIKNCEPRPKKVIINHGESSRCLDLASSIHKAFRVETSAPRNLECIRIK